MAAIYARTKQYDQMYIQPEAAVKAAKGFDERPAHSNMSTVLLGEVSQKKSDFETTDSRTLCGVMREKWLAADDFDSVRCTTKFIEIVRVLQ